MNRAGKKEKEDEEDEEEDWQLTRRSTKEDRDFRLDEHAKLMHVPGPSTKREGKGVIKNESYERIYQSVVRTWPSSSVNENKLTGKDGQTQSLTNAKHSYTSNLTTTHTVAVPHQ